MENPELFEKIEEFVEGAGLMLVDLAVKNIGRSYMVRLLVDRPGGINIRECAELSRIIKDYIDGNMILSNYRLEVGSPGIGRLLTTDVDWARSIGRKLSIQMEDDEFTDWLLEYNEGYLKFKEGRILSAGDIVRAVEVLE